MPQGTVSLSGLWTELEIVSLFSVSLTVPGYKHLHASKPEFQQQWVSHCCLGSHRTGMVALVHRTMQLHNRNQ